ncbi:MAG TPA: aminotransferase class V-fold PLP-dependent enzyme [Myxococcaceae bacterium]
MALSRRAFLARNGLAAGALLAPGQLLAALEAATPPTPRLDDWASVRKQFRLTPEYLHFAGFFIASHPAPVRDAIDAWRKTIDENPFLTVEHGLFEDESANVQSRVREAAAAYRGGKPDEVCLTQNTTTGLALVYLGLPLKPGQEVLCTEHDHISHHESIRFATDRTGATYRKIPLFVESSKASVDEVVGRIRSAVRPATRAVGVTWVHSQSGIRLPILAISRAIGELNQKRDAQDRIVLVVDGVHGLGCVDETVAELGADYFCAGTHKWIYGPRGTGLVWARPDAWARLRPLIPTFSDREQYQAWIENRPEHTPNNARRMTPGGFQAYEHQWGTVAAFKMAQAMGRARVAARVTELNTRIKDGLAAMKGVTLHTPRDPALSAGICCFEVAGKKPGDVVKALLSKKVLGSTSPYANVYARLSAAIFNTEAEVDQALGALRTSIA